MASKKQENLLTAEAIKEALIPALVPAVKEAMIPALKGELVPAVKEALIPVLKGELIPAITEAVIPAVRKALLPDIADLFETQSAQQNKKMDLKFKEMKSELIHEVKVLLENDERLSLAMEAIKIASAHSTQLKDHSKRIGKLETDVRTLK